MLINYYQICKFLLHSLFWALSFELIIKTGKLVFHKWLNLLYLIWISYLWIPTAFEADLKAKILAGFEKAEKQYPAIVSTYRELDQNDLPTSFQDTYLITSFQWLLNFCISKIWNWSQSVW